MKENYKEYNLLTKRLLEEGYSAEHHPDHVRVDVPMCQEKTLEHRLLGKGKANRQKSSIHAGLRRDGSQKLTSQKTDYCTITYRF